MSRPDATVPLAHNASRPGRSLERRGHKRHLTTLRVAKLIAEGREMLGIVRNISNGGMMIDLCAPIDIGGRLTVSLDEAQSLPGRIVWKKGSVLGLQFHNSVDIANVISKPGAFPNGKIRRKPRVVAAAPVFIAFEASSLITHLYDISQNGLKVAMDDKLHVDKKVVIKIDDLGSFNASVQWTTTDYAGLRLTNELPLRDLIAWLAKQQTPEPASR